MLRCLLVLAVLLCAWSLPAQANPRCLPSSATLPGAVESYVVRMEDHPLTAGSPVVAPPTGGIFGWIIPALYVWYPQIEGDLSLDGTGASVSLDNDLQLESRELVFMPELQVSLGTVGLRFSAFFARFSGSGTVEETFSFGGETFTVNERIDTDLSLDNYRLLTMVPLVRTDNFQLAFEGGISLFVIDAEVRGETVGTASESVTVPVPSVGILLQAKVGPVIFEADVSGFYFNWFGVDAVFVDAQFTVGYTFLKVCGVRAGYRAIFVDASYDDFGIDAVLHGPFVGVSLQF